MTNKAPPPAKVQPDDVPVGLMFGLLTALTVVVIGVLLMVWQVFGSQADKTINDQFLAKPDKKLQEVTKRNRMALAGYDVIDAKKGIYRMPIRRAMQMLVANTNLLAPAPKPVQVKKAARKPEAAAAPGAAQGAADKAADKQPAAPKQPAAKKTP